MTCCHAKFDFVTRTIDIYNKNAREFAETFESCYPTRMYELVHAFFHHEKETIDVGCGSGRDVAYLKKHGYPTIGLDASDEILNEARERHPDCEFRLDTLPSLSTVSPASFGNILASAVLMHLSEGELVTACLRLLEILNPKGRAIISVRGPASQESDKGRLFTPISPSQLAELFESIGGKILLLEKEFEGDKLWHYLVIEKTDLEKRDGIARIQDIIINDNKTASYKLALLRSLCDLARSESQTVIWDPALDFVIVPLERLAISWLRYYWEPVRRDIRQVTSGSPSFAPALKDLFTKYPTSRDAIEAYDSETPDPRVEKVLREIAKTINDQPVRYAGGGNNPVFQRRQTFDIVLTADSWQNQFYSMKGIKVPASIWRDIRLFHHWIEKSLLLEWIELTMETLDPRRTATEIFEAIYNANLTDERSTQKVRDILDHHPKYCIWTGKKLASYHVDHVIPWALWRNNHYWNLLPADSQVNGQKSMFLPYPELLRKNSSIVLDYWTLYQREFGDQFVRQALRALGTSKQEFSLEETFQKLLFVTAQLHNSRGIAYYSP